MYPVKATEFKVLEKLSLNDYEIIDYGVKMLGAPLEWNSYDLITGKGIKVLVLDTGAPNHSDLEITDAKNFTTDKSVEDKNGHSSHVCGLLGARQNGFGVVGGAPDVTIYCGKVLSDKGLGQWEWLAHGIEWGIELGVDIISMSLGASEKPPKIVHDAIKKAYNAGITLVAAAGNTGKEEQHWPASYKECISVGAVDMNKQKASFSTMSKDVEFTTAGAQVLSTYLDNSYARLSGTCLVGNTAVYTEDGYKNISDIKIGDNVISYNTDRHDFEYKTVTNHLSNGIQKVYKVSFGNRNIVATENHPFLVLRKTNERKYPPVYRYYYEWIQLKDLNKGDEIVCIGKIEREIQIPKIKHKQINMNINIPKEVTPDLMRLFGLYLGDGTILTNGQQICFAEFNEELKKQYKKLIKNIFNTEATELERGIYIHSVDVVEIFNELDMNGNVKTKRVPSWVFKLPEDHLFNFLCGLIDSDGTVDKNGNITFELSNYNLLRDIKYILELLRIKSSNIGKRTRKNYWAEKRGTGKSFCTSYSLRISYGAVSQHLFYFNQVWNLKYKENLSKLKSTKRKHSIKREDDKHRSWLNKVSLEKIRKIEYMGKEEVFDITVNENHNFVAEGIVVHNSMATPLFSSAVALMLQKGMIRHGRRLSPEEVRFLASIYSEDNGELGRDTKYGFGVFSFARIIKEELPPIEVEMTIGSTKYLVNGVEKEMDTTPILDENDRTLVPVRFVSQSLGAEVNWSPEEPNKVRIIRK